MMKHLFGSALVLAVLAFCGAGCGVFSNETPPENTVAVEEAYDDPTLPSNNTGLGGNPGNPNAWVAGADDNFAAATADADGWVEADPTGNRLNMPVIYFAYDSDVLVPSEQTNLDRIAQYLKANPSLALLIEGHCDQRGTEEYNRALGERRANAIRAYLAGRGVADARMKTLSYGEDKPSVEGSGEAVWGQNRRGVPIPMKMPQR
ncbi:MAG: OmpA family protein [Victivallales bacterium]|nr:OmpA family protein [Victivallales bacterium]